MIEIIGGSFAAGETKTFTINGEYLEILEAQYPCDVMLMDKAGAQLSIMKSSEASFFSRPREGFQTVQIYTAQAQFIRIFIGSGDAGTRRISSTVQVVDGGRLRVNAGVCFAASKGHIGAAGKTSSAQLWNPAGSGVRLIVAQAGVGCAASANIYMYRATAAQASLGYVINKMLGGAVGKGEVRSEDATGIAPAVGNVIQSYSLSAGALWVWRMTEPIVIPPGNGLGIVSDALATQMQTSFEWFEEAI